MKKLLILLLGLAVVACIASVAVQPKPLRLPDLVYFGPTHTDQQSIFVVTSEEDNDGYVGLTSKYFFPPRMTKAYAIGPSHIGENVGLGRAVRVTYGAPLQGQAATGRRVISKYYAMPADIPGTDLKADAQLDNVTFFVSNFP